VCLSPDGGEDLLLWLDVSPTHGADSDCRRDACSLCLLGFETDLLLDDSMQTRLFGVQEYLWLHLQLSNVSQNGFAIDSQYLTYQIFELVQPEHEEMEAYQEAPGDHLNQKTDLQATGRHH
jgi:hypothetical protein